jgi:uncharacterized membrane protein YkoI
MMEALIRKIKMTHKKTELGFAHLTLLVLIVLLAIGGVGYYVMKHQKSTKPLNSETVSADTTLATPLPTDLLTVDKIKALATAQKPTASILGVGLENEDGTLLFKVKLSDGTVLTFNAKTGDAIKNTAEAELEGTAALPAGVSPTIDFAKARDIAMAQMSGSTVKKIELELEDGTLVYSVRFTNGGRVDVNANNSSIVKTKAGNKTEDKKDSKSGSSSTESSTSTSGSRDSTETHNSTSTETETHNTTTTDDDDSSHGGNSGSGSGH